MKDRRKTGGKTKEKWGKLKENRWKPSNQAILLL
jgi:hypothetical protein